MSRNVTIEHFCDVCGSAMNDALTKTAFVVFIDKMERRISGYRPVPRFSIHPWRDDIAASNQAKHLCSETCLREELEEWTGGPARATEAPASESPLPPPVNETESAEAQA